MKWPFSRKILWASILLVALVLFLWWRGIFNPARPQDTVREIGERTMNIFSGAGFSFDEDTPGYENLARLRQGCPFKDCIPSIDNPQFESAAQADTWLRPEDIVFGLDYKGVQRVYPQRILNWHELVNDTVAADPILVSFCPLCGSALAFSREVDDKAVEFGVSGKLLNNDLIMYDRQTESLWEQITAKAIVGEHFGKKLTQIPMDTLPWSQWRQKHPQTEVLSRNTGYSRDYDRYPYGSYEQDTSALFPVEGGVDETIHPKAVVYGIEVDGVFKAYSEEKLEAEGVISDRVGGVPLRLSWSQGTLLVENLRTREEVVATRLFWFAWKAFHPETELYE